MANLAPFKGARAANPGSRQTGRATAETKIKKPVGKPDRTIVSPALRGVLR
jgi:hypothetical protein